MISTPQYPITLTLTEPQPIFKSAGILTEQQLKIMEGLRTFPAPLKSKKKIGLTDCQKFKINCVKEFVEPVVVGWTQVEAP